MPTHFLNSSLNRQIWIRICISISAAHILAVFGFVLYECWVVFTDQQGWEQTFFFDTKRIYDCYPSEDAACVHFQPYDIVKIYDQVRVYVLVSLRLDRALPVAFTPILFLWALAFLAHWTFGSLRKLPTPTTQPAQASAATYPQPSLASRPAAKFEDPEEHSHKTVRRQNTIHLATAIGCVLFSIVALGLSAQPYPPLETLQFYARRPSFFVTTIFGAGIGSMIIFLPLGMLIEFVTSKLAKREYKFFLASIWLAFMSAAKLL